MQNCNKKFIGHKNEIYAFFFTFTIFLVLFSSRFFSRLPLFSFSILNSIFCKTKEIYTLVLYVCYCVQSVMETSPKNPVRETSSPNLHKPLLLDTSHILTPTIIILHTQNTSLPDPAGALPSIV